MLSDSLLLLACVLLVALCALSVLLLLRGPPGTEALQHLLLLAEQGAAGQRAEAEATRARLADAERALATRAEQSRLELQHTLGTLLTTLARDGGDARALMEQKLREMGEQSAQRLADIQRSVSEGLQQAVERSVHGSFQRVVDQFAQVQKAVTDVQAVTAQIGDLKRIFSNVKTRGGWGEMHLRALLDDVLPAGAYQTNRKLREDSDDVVEFALLMPMKGAQRPLLAIDAKFPAEDFDRLLLAAEAGDQDAERAARRGLEARLRGEAKKIGGKYINPPITVDFAVMYLPTDGLYVEAARMPGLIEGLNRDHRVLLMGPSLVPALLRTIQLGILTLSLEQKTDEIQRLLGATRTEMGRMDLVLDKLAKQAGAFSNTIDSARTRTRSVNRKLRSIEALEAEEADALLELEDETEPAAPFPSGRGPG
jgi:DNA recombination protein RmuC